MAWQDRPILASAKPGPPRCANTAKDVSLGGLEAAELLLDREKAFEVFKKTHPSAAFEENKNLLKERIVEAKGLGDETNEVRALISDAKKRLERLRTERAMTSDSSVETPEERVEMEEIERLRGIYLQNTDSLRRVKGEVEKIQRLLEQNRVRTQREFATWFASLRKQVSLHDIDEEKKRELYERVKGADSKAEEAPVEGASTAASTVSSAAPSAVPSAVPAGAAPAAVAATTAAAVGAPASLDMDDDVSAYYAALNELAKQS